MSGKDRSRLSGIALAVPLALVLQAFPLIASPATPTSAAPTHQTQVLSADTSTTTADPAFTPVAPMRVMDTRARGYTPDGLGIRLGTVSTRTPRSVRVAGRGDVPASGVAAVVLTVTAVSPTTDTSVTVYPTGSTRTSAPSLSIRKGETFANLVIAKVGVNGSVTFVTNAGSAHVIADLSGYFPVGSSYQALTPGRLLDTRRDGMTVDGRAQRAGPLKAGEVRTLPVSGRYGIPRAGVAAVALTVTGIKASSATSVKVWPAGDTQPLATNLTLAKGGTRTTLVLAKPGAGGAVSITQPAGLLDVVVDVAGWIPNGTTYSPMPPARLVDTRAGGQTIDGKDSGGGLPHNRVHEVQIAGRAGIPSTAKAVAVNVTGIKPLTSGRLEVFPGWVQDPQTSTLSVGVGETRSNLAILAIGLNGKLTVHNWAGDMNLVLDVVGWFADPTPGAPIVLPDATAGASPQGPYTVGVADQSWLTVCEVTPLTALPPGGELISRSGGDPQGTHWLFTLTNPVWGIYDFALHYACAGPVSVNVAYRIHVNPAPLVLAGSIMRSALVGVPFAYQFFVDGGVSPYTWRVVAGALPPGFALSPDGRLSASSPDTSGDYRARVEVADASGAAATQEVTLHVA